LYHAHISLRSLIETNGAVAVTFLGQRASETTEFLIGPWKFNYTRPIYSAMRPLEFDYWRGISVSDLGKLVWN